MARSDATALSYFGRIKKDFAQNQYTIVDMAGKGLAVAAVQDPSPPFMNLLQINIDSPGLLTETERDYIIDYLEYL